MCGYEYSLKFLIILDTKNILLSCGFIIRRSIVYKYFQSASNVLPVRENY